MKFLSYLKKVLGNEEQKQYDEYLRYLSIEHKNHPLVESHKLTLRARVNQFIG